MLPLWETGDGHTGVLSGKLRERDNLKDLGVKGRIILQSVFKMWDGEARTGMIWLSTGTVGGLL
jgi:hypothetical protein